MNRKVTVFDTHFILMLAVALTVISLAAFLSLPGQAQTTGQQPDGAVSVTAATVSSRISYQGVLKEGGTPVTGSRNFTFRFYSDGGCATPAGSAIGVPNVSVVAGLFSVKLEVSQELFDGQGLWLGVAVGGAGNVTCEEITPVPYALSLRPGAVIVGSIAGSAVLSVTNTYSPTVGAAAVAIDDSFAVYGLSVSGTGVGGLSHSGPGVDGHSVSGPGVDGSSVSGPGVHGSSYSGAGVRGESYDGNGGDFTTYGESSYGIRAQGGAGGKAARFDGGVEINGDVNLNGEIYARSLHTTSGGTTTSGVTSSGNASYNSVYSRGNLGVDGRSEFVGDVTMYHALMVAGAKSAVVATASHGERKLYADESAEVYFFDRGGGQLVSGVAVIALDPVWLETVTIDADHPMRVQVTLTGDCNGVYVAEKTIAGPSTGSGQASFTVRELRGGTSNATFDWEVAAKRKGYEDVRLAPAAEP